MRRTLLVVFIVTAAALLALGQKDTANRTMTNDEDALKQLVREWADAVVRGDLQKLEKFADDNFRGNAEGISFNKHMLREAIRSGQMKVASWDCNNDDMKVSVRGNAATVTGRCTLSNAVYMGKDFSGGWDFTDRFVKQKDGGWRAVSSQAKRIKQ